MKKIILLQLLFISIYGFSQNLVPNPSFETYTTCPQGPGTLGTDVPPWSTPDTATPDYYNVCFTPIFPGAASMDVPGNIQGFQNARTGLGYAGLIAYEETFGFPSDYREYLQVQLTSPLSAGQIYCVEFYWNLAGKSVYYVEQMGVYFSNTVTNLTQSTTLPFTPQVSVSGTPLDDTTNWVVFQQNYTAVGGEQYIIIGNFVPTGTAVTGTTGTPSNISTGGDFAYYYIEDVSVSLGNCVTPCDATINLAGPFCSTDPAVGLTSLFTGGTWTGTGITNGTLGTFDPGTAGVGSHVITYTLSCGDVQTTTISVSACGTMSVCIETNGDLTVSGGLAPFTWESQSTTLDCSACPFGICSPPLCSGVQAPSWTASGVTVAGPGAGLYPIQVIDANGVVLVINSSGSLASCSSTCTPPTLTNTQVDVTCLGGNDGSINLTVSGTSTYGASWSNSATTEDITGLIAGSYTVIVTDQLDATCTATTTVIILDGAQPTVIANASAIAICSGDPVTLTGSGALTYTWTGTTTNPTNGVVFNPTITDTYTVTGTDGSGCTSTDVITITVNNCTVPIASFTASNTTLCEGDCISFTDQSTGTNISVWAWSFPGAMTTTSSLQNPTSICYPTAGTYAVTLIVTDANGTDDSTMVNYITVTNCTLPTAAFSASSVSICQGDCINFTDQSTGTVGTVAYNWSFPGASTTVSTSTNPSNICYLTPGNYTVTLSITDSNGTDGSTMTNYITVGNCVSPTANFSASDTTICQGDCIDFTDLSTGGATSWLWSFSGGLPSSSTTQNPAGICFQMDGVVDIILIVSNSQGVDTITQTITIIPSPTVDAGADVTINAGVSTTLEATGSVGNFMWSPDSALTCITCEITEASPEWTTTYIVTLTDANGCTAWDDVIVNTIFIEGIGVPSAFSPNGDNLNDILYVEGAGIVTLEFTIYNRYGQKVFESNDKTIGWDGSFNGKPENPGVFAYVAIYKLVGGGKGVLKGDITLIK